ncbi:MAG TPA: energy transducer TonB [Candidatus Acidoferrum sp.]|nr:energy transducer TonB [Candidatus Acidoferrum sp.]
MTTMIVDPPRRTTMGVGLQSNRGRAGDPQAWRKAIGTRPVSARLALLPEPERRWDRIGVSAFGQIAVIAFLLLIPLIFPEQMKTALNLRPTEIMQPVTLIPVAPPPPPPPEIKKVLPKPKAVEPRPEPPKLNPRQEHVFLTAKAIQPEIKKVEVKPVELNPQFDQPKAINTDAKQPKRPKDDVKVGMMSTGSAAPATVVAPLNKVQTGGFGDPNGIPGKGDPNHATNVNRLGSPALPGGDGYGNGTGGAKGIRGTVASTGFGNGTANPPPSKKTGTVQAGGFADQTVATEAPKKRAASSENPTTSVDITEKPRPEYTAEGRSMKIEGDVVIDMVFLANGTVQVNRVISGLGHGLDEAAMRAAQQIKFKPAKRDGQPVDFPARVRIEFRLAY